jgi:hypothetical protein
MCGDVLSCARAECDADYGDPVCAVVSTASHVGSLAVRLDGISRYRNADEGNAVRERRACSSPDGHKKIFPKCRLGADPRVPLGWTPRLRPVQSPAAHEPAGDTGNSAGGDTPGLPLSSARSGWHANAASGLLPPDMPDHNTATGHTRAERTARSLSTDNGAASASDKSLALKKFVDHEEPDPRERQLPKGQAPERISTPRRDALCLLPYPSVALRSSLIATISGHHLSADGARCLGGADDGRAAGPADAPLPHL